VRTSSGKKRGSKKISDTFPSVARKEEEKGKCAATAKKGEANSEITVGKVGVSDTEERVVKH